MARVVALEAANALDHAGIPCAVHDISIDDPLLPTDLADCRAFIVAGGDGTVLHASRLAIDAQCPIYHLPTGNENLFARAFGMTTDPSQLVEAIRKQVVQNASVGRLRTETAELPFLLMCSIGPDAGVIRRLSQTRTRATGHRAYFKPVLAEVFTPLLPRLTIEVDGKTLVEERPGWVIVANTREYALHLDPVPTASMVEQQLNVVFMPAQTSLGAFVQLLSARHGPSHHLHTAGQEIKITTTPSNRAPICCQIDGEAGPAMTGTITTACAREQLRVLVPSSREPVNPNSRD